MNYGECKNKCGKHMLAQMLTLEIFFNLRLFATCACHKNSCCQNAKPHSSSLCRWPKLVRWEKSVTVRSKGRWLFYMWYHVTIGTGGLKMHSLTYPLEFCKIKEMTNECQTHFNCPRWCSDVHKKSTCCDWTVFFFRAIFKMTSGMNRHVLNTF